MKTTTKAVLCMAALFLIGCSIGFGLAGGIFPAILTAFAVIGIGTAINLEDNRESR